MEGKEGIYLRLNALSWVCLRKKEREDEVDRSLTTSLSEERPAERRWWPWWWKIVKRRGGREERGGEGTNHLINSRSHQSRLLFVLYFHSLQCNRQLANSKILKTNFFLLLNRDTIVIMIRQKTELTFSSISFWSICNNKYYYPCPPINESILPSVSSIFLMDTFTLTAAFVISAHLFIRSFTSSSAPLLFNNSSSNSRFWACNKTYFKWFLD